MASKTKWRLFGKLTVADILIILIFLILAAAVIYKIKTPEPVKLDKIRFEFYVESVPSYAAQNVKKGDNIIESTDGNQVGTVVDKIINDAVIYMPDSEGKYVKTSQEGFNSIIVIGETYAEYDNNCFESNEKEYNLGKTYGLKIGNELFYGRIRSIEKE